jgi:hypothetical protein
MFQKFVVKIQRWVSLPAEDLTKLLTWSNSSGLQIDNPNLLVAKATDTTGKAMGYLTAEPVFIVSNYATAPNAQQVGDSIDLVLERESRKIGAGKFLIVLPDGVPPERDEKILRVIEREIKQKPTTFDLQHKYSDSISTRNRNEVNQPTSLTAKWNN